MEINNRDISYFWHLIFKTLSFQQKIVKEVQIRRAKNQKLREEVEKSG